MVQLIWLMNPNDAFIGNYAEISTFVVKRQDFYAVLFLYFSKQSTFCHRLSIALHDIFYVFSKTPETDFITVSYCLILSGKIKTPKFMQDKYLRKYFVHLRLHVDLNQHFLSWKSSSPSLIYNRKRKDTQQLQHFPPIF